MPQCFSYPGCVCVCVSVCAAQYKICVYNYFSAVFTLEKIYWLVRLWNKTWSTRGPPIWTWPCSTGMEVRPRFHRDTVAHCSRGGDSSISFPPTQARTRTRTRTCPWTRSAVCPSRPLRARTTSDSAGASSGALSAPTTVSGCSLSPRRMAPKVNKDFTLNRRSWRRRLSRSEH